MNLLELKVRIPPLTTGHPRPRMEDDRIKRLLTDVAKTVHANMEKDHDNVDVQVECQMVKQTVGFGWDYTVLVQGEPKNELVAEDAA